MPPLDLSGIVRHLRVFRSSLSVFLAMKTVR
jgi:hypothetical protein